jgi:AraC-like DNA-binding protein
MFRSSDYEVDTGSVYALVLIGPHKEMLARGVPAQALLAGTGLDDAALLDPYAIIGRNQAVQYYRNLVRLAPTPGIGLDIGLTSRLSDYGSSGYSTMTTATTEEAIESSHRHYQLQYLHADWQTEVTQEAIVHSCFVDESLEDLEVFLCERGFTVLQKHSEELLGPECFPEKLCLRYPDPGYARRYQEIFHCPVYFGCEMSEVHYPVRYLDQRIASHDPDVHEALESVSAMLIQKLSAESDIVTAVKLAIAEKSGSFPSIERVAERLHLSSRTLSRKLRDSGTNFQSLLDEARQAVAEDRLRHSKMSIQQIAEACGFRDAQNFSQAFKRWSGLSPSEFRKGPGAPDA